MNHKRKHATTHNNSQTKTQTFSTTDERANTQQHKKKQPDNITQELANKHTHANRTTAQTQARERICCGRGGHGTGHVSPSYVDDDGDDVGNDDHADDKIMMMTLITMTMVMTMMTMLMMTTMAMMMMTTIAMMTMRCIQPNKFVCGKASP